MHLQGVFHGIFAFLAVGHVNAEMDTRDIQAIRKLELSPSAMFALEGKKEEKQTVMRLASAEVILELDMTSRVIVSAQADLNCMHQIDVSRDNPSVIDGLAIPL